MIVIQIYIKKLTPFEQYNFLWGCIIYLLAVVSHPLVYFIGYLTISSKKGFCYNVWIYDLTVIATQYKIQEKQLGWTKGLLSTFSSLENLIFINFILRWSFSFFRLSEVTDGVIITNSVEVCSIIYFSGASVSSVSSFRWNGRCATKPSAAILLLEVPENKHNQCHY